MKAPARDGRFAERVVEGLDDGGSPERVVIWIERRAGALWAVGRQVNPQHRESEEPRADDYVWEGHELDDCLEAANDALGRRGGVGGRRRRREVRPFHRDELLAPLAPCAFGRLRPLEVRIRDRIAVRVVRREAERTVDAGLELLGDDVLEAVGFVVDVVDVHAERLGEIQLEQRWWRITSSATRSPASVSLRPGTARASRRSSAASFLTIADADAGARAEVARERADGHAAVSVLQLVHCSSGSPGSTTAACTVGRVTWLRAIRVGHFAEPDDAFMVSAVRGRRVDMRGLELEPVVSDIQTLNEWALEGRLEVTALSRAPTPQVSDRYLLLPHGASFGEAIRPIVVARARRRPARGRDRHARPATTAKRVLHLALGDAIRTRDLPFDEVLDEVVSGRAEAGLLIHEGQLTYADSGLVKLLDLGLWWDEHVGLPLPLGLVGIRRDVERRDDVSAVLRDAIAAGLANRGQALAYAMQFGRGIDEATADRFVSMYVNDLTLDMGERGRAAVAHLLGKEPEFAR